MWIVRYDTLNDTYIKEFRTHEEAEKFCNLISRLYPEQKPAPKEVFKK